MPKIYKRHCDYCGKYYEGCGKQFCSKKCASWSRYGNDMARFWNNVQIPNLLDCWIWTGSKFWDGYGEIRFDGKTRRAHRVAWQLAFGEIPKNLCVLHRCDNRECVNPAHLFLGTRADNAMDRVQKGRGAMGERSGGSKLKEADVIAIRKLSAEGWTQMRIGGEYGISSGHVWSIVNRTQWKHI